MWEELSEFRPQWLRTARVTDAKTVNGNKMLSLAAEEAVKKWKFVASDAQSIVDIDINFEPSN